MKAIAWLAVAVLLGGVACSCSRKAQRAGEAGNDARPSAASYPASSPTGVGGDWPIFRGDRGMAGVANGELGEAFTLLWRFQTGGPVKSSPVVGGGMVYIGSGDSKVYAIDLANGREVWSHAAGDAVEAPPMLLKDAVLVGSNDNYLYCLSASDGKERWRYKTGDKIVGSANWFAAPGDGSLRVIVGSYDQKLHCVDFTGGRGLWSYLSESFVNGSPAVEGLQAAFGSCDVTLHVVNLSSGVSAAQIDLGKPLAAGPAFVGGRVFIGNMQDAFFCVDAPARRTLWERKTDCMIYASAAIGEGRVVLAGRDGRLRCLDMKGRPMWTFQTRKEINSSPVICGDKVVVGSNDGRVYVVSLANGNEVWSYQIGSPIVSSPAVTGGRIIIGCDDGFVYAFGPK